MSTSKLRPSEARKSRPKAAANRVVLIPVSSIRPEEGLSRKRSRAGHEELCESIRRFGVLTPITVRPAPNAEGQFILIKGQGRTLACQLLGIDHIPAVVVTEHFSDEEKVQQFLVENVARLKMTSVERALLIAHARRSGEETSDVAHRFGVSATTVRRLELQLADVRADELAALRGGSLTLATHAIITKYADDGDRSEMVAIVEDLKPNASTLNSLLAALSWRQLAALGPKYRTERLALLRWALEQFAEQPLRMPPRARLRLLSERLVSHPHFEHIEAAV